MKAIELAVDVYKISKKFPKDEIYGLTSQIRRAVISISSNLAEGAGRSSKKDFRRFVDISIGSLNETESLLIVSSRLDFVQQNIYLETKTKVEELGRILNGLKRYLSN